MTYRTLAEIPEPKPMDPEKVRFLAARRLALNLIAKYPTTAEELVRDMFRTEELGNVIAMIASRENLSLHELIEIGESDGIEVANSEESSSAEAQTSDQGFWLEASEQVGSHRQG